MPRSLHRFALRLSLIAGLALFFAQLGAMAHTYSHGLAANTSPTQHAQQGSHDFCSDCLNFAPLLAAAGGPSALPFIARHMAGAEPVTVLFFHRGYPAPLAFRSRAPPIP